MPLRKNKSGLRRECNLRKVQHCLTKYRISFKFSLVPIGTTVDSIVYSLMMYTATYLLKINWRFSNNNEHER